MLNDDVEDIFLKLWEIEEFKSYFVPIWREETVEGSFNPTTRCAQPEMVRDFARKNNAPLARSAPTWPRCVTLSELSPNAMACRRKERQNMVGGEVVENDDE